ncbi:MAG: hypothetical protein CM1200mP2_37530 [Planctomycetaceae bacterium]|nr:MAG: hypothetical protein CM1200mP2_37530 [Planctomycetaceae bacterium]
MARKAIVTSASGIPHQHESEFTCRDCGNQFLGALTSMKLVAMRSSIALGLVLACLVCLVGYDSPEVASADGGGPTSRRRPCDAWSRYGRSCRPSQVDSHQVLERVGPVVGEGRVVGAESWDRDAHPADPRGRFRSPGGQICPRCRVWKAYSAPDGFMNFYSEDVLPGVTKMVVEDGAGRWAGAAAYAHTYLHGRNQDVAFVVESGQPVVVWLNGTRLPEQDGGRFPMQLDTVEPAPGQSSQSVEHPRCEACVPQRQGSRAIGRCVPAYRCRGGTGPAASVQCKDPERNSPAPAKRSSRTVSTTLRGPGDRRPLFVRGEPTDLTLTIRAAAGAYEHFPANPHDQYEGEAWTYAAPPKPATTSADSGVSLDELRGRSQAGCGLPLRFRRQPSFG